MVVIEVLYQNKQCVVLSVLPEHHTAMIENEVFCLSTFFILELSKRNKKDLIYNKEVDFKGS